MTGLPGGHFHREAFWNIANAGNTAARGFFSTSPPLGENTAAYRTTQSDGVWKSAQQSMYLDSQTHREYRDDSRSHFPIA